MDYESKISELVGQRESLEHEKDKISYKLKTIEEDINNLERELKMNMVSDLTEDEENWLRDELTLVGKILCGDDVVFGGLDLLHEDPDEMHTSGYFGPEHSKKFSIEIKLSICTEFQASFRCNVVVKTKSQKIDAIVREMFESSEDSYNPLPCRRNWSIDWDYHNNIIMKKPYKRPDDKSIKL